MKAENEDSTQLKEFPMLWLKGFLMGSADVVPGVSGGTMALILGIYERLLSAIKSVNSSVIKDLIRFKWLRAFQQIHVLFLVMLFSGIVTALGFFTKVVPLQVYMFTHPEIVFGLFFGLILGSVSSNLDTYSNVYHHIGLLELDIFLLESRQTLFRLSLHLLGLILTS